MSHSINQSIDQLISQRSRLLILQIIALTLALIGLDYQKMSLQQQPPVSLNQAQQPQPQSGCQHPQWLADLQTLFKDPTIRTFLTSQIDQILPLTHSVIVIYQKLFIKFKTHPHPDQPNSYMLKISKSFPLDNSVRLYLLDSPYQPKISDTRDLLRQLLGKPWTLDTPLCQILQKIPALQQKLQLRNQNHLALQTTGDFLLGDVFLYNQLEQHTSLTLFIDKSQPTTNLLNAVSETHFLVFQRVVKKSYKSKEEEDYEMKSKTLYGKKFMLSKFCALQCISSLQVSTQAREVSIGIVKYRSLRSMDDFQQTTKKLTFPDEQTLRQFLRLILKNLPKHQPTKIAFLPCYDKSPESKEDLSVQKVLELNQLEQRLDSRSSSKTPTDPAKLQQLLNRLNKSYQKMIEYYSARANPYYLIYVNKLNWLYLKYFVEEKQHKERLMKKTSYEEKIQPFAESDAGEKKDETIKTKSKLAKSLTLNY